jgi:O-antigen/teichoic acid export membrane protein
MSIIKSLIKGGAWLTLADIVSKLASALTLPLIARLLGVEALGIYAVIFQLIQSSQTMGGLGVPIALQRNGARYEAIGEEAVGRLFGVGLVIICVVSGCIGLGIFFFRDFLAQHWLGQPEVATWLRFALPICLLLPLGSVPLLFLSALQDFRGYALRSSLGRIVESFIVVIFAWWLGLKGAFIGMVLGAITQIIWSYLIVKPVLKARDICLRFDQFWRETKSIFKLGFPYYSGNTLLGTIIGLPLMGLVSQYGGLEQLGYIRVAQSIASLIGFVPTAIAPVAFSYLSSSLAGDHQSHQKLKSLHFRGVWIFLLLAIVPACLLLPKIISLLYGVEYQGANILSWLYLWITLLSGITSMLVQYLTVESKTVRVGLSSTLGSIGWALSAIILVPKYSGLGFLLAQAIGQSAGFIMVFKPAMETFFPADRSLIKNLLFLTFISFSLSLFININLFNSTLSDVIITTILFLIFAIFFKRVLFQSEQIQIKKILKS